MKALMQISNIKIKSPKDYTRPWFAWANSMFADCIFYLIENKPHLVLK